MSKKTIGYIVAGIVVVGGIIWMMSSGTDKSGTTGGGNETASGTVTKTSMKSLLASSAPQKCTFDNTIGGNRSFGTIYAGGGKMRTDFINTSVGKSAESHLVAKDNMVYVWSTVAAQGIKMPLTTATAPGNEGADFNAEGDYKCEPWSVDATLFTLPNGVTFVDLSAMAQ